MDMQMEPQTVRKLSWLGVLMLACLVIGGIITAGVLSGTEPAGETVKRVEPAPAAASVVIETLPARSVYVPRDVTIIGDNNDVVVGNDPVEDEEGLAEDE